MTTSISLAQFHHDPAEVARLASLGLTIRVYHGKVLCFTVTPPANPSR